MSRDSREMQEPARPSRHYGFDKSNRSWMNRMIVAASVIFTIASSFAAGSVSHCRMVS